MENKSIIHQLGLSHLELSFSTNQVIQDGKIVHQSIWNATFTFDEFDKDSVLPCLSTSSSKLEWMWDLANSESDIKNMHQFNID